VCSPRLPREQTWLATSTLSRLKTLRPSLSGRQRVNRRSAHYELRHNCIWRLTGGTDLSQVGRGHPPAACRRRRGGLEGISSMDYRLYYGISARSAEFLTGGSVSEHEFRRELHQPRVAAVNLVAKNRPGTPQRHLVLGNPLAQFRRAGRMARERETGAQPLSGLSGPRGNTGLPAGGECGASTVLRCRRSRNVGGDLPRRNVAWWNIPSSAA
jgi:hypothetical protein